MDRLPRENGWIPPWNLTGRYPKWGHVFKEVHFPNHHFLVSMIDFGGAFLGVMSNFQKQSISNHIYYILYTHIHIFFVYLSIYTHLRNIKQQPVIDFTVTCFSKFSCFSYSPDSLSSQTNNFRTVFVMALNIKPLPKTNIALKIDGWKTSLSFWVPAYF